MIDFKKLKQASSGQAALTKLAEKLNKVATKQGRDKDDRFWYPNVDKAGNGYAVVRFLPAVHEEDNDPYIRLWHHAFKGPSGSWYFENSLTTLGLPDPVSEYNTSLWNTGLDSDKEEARKQKRKLSFFSNIYVITDEQNPENQGKVFLFKYGKKIFDKLNSAMNPEFKDETALNPFNLWEGANLKIKIRNVEGQRNYDKSEFGPVGPLFKTDEEIEAVLAQAHSLNQFIAPDQFKSYDVLKTKFNSVMGIDGSNPAAARAAASKAAAKSIMDEDDETPAPTSRATASKAETITDQEQDWLDSL